MGHTHSSQEATSARWGGIIKCGRCKTCMLRFPIKKTCRRSCLNNVKLKCLVGRLASHNTGQGTWGIPLNLRTVKLTLKALISIGWLVKNSVLPSTWGQHSLSSVMTTPSFPSHLQQTNPPLWEEMSLGYHPKHSNISQAMLAYRNRKAPRSQKPRCQAQKSRWRWGVVCRGPSAESKYACLKELNHSRPQPINTEVSFWVREKVPLKQSHPSPFLDQRIVFPPLYQTQSQFYWYKRHWAEAPWSGSLTQRGWLQNVSLPLVSLGIVRVG